MNRSPINTGTIWIKKDEPSKLVRIEEAFRTGFAFSYLNQYRRETKATRLITAKRLRTAFVQFLPA